MKKLLFLSPTFPFPADKGWHARISNLLGACAADYEVTFVGPAPEDENARRAMEQIAKNIITVTPRADNISTAARLRYSARAFEMLDAPRARALRDYQESLAGLDLKSFDLIWAERRDLFLLMQGRASNVVLDLDDIEHRKLLKELQLRTGLVSKLKGLPRLAGVFAWEILMPRFARAVLVCADEDKAYLEKFGLRNVVTVPNGTSLQAADRSALPSETRNAVFLGNMVYPPNADAVAYFARDVIPLIRQRYPDFHLNVIGNPPADVSSYADGVKFLGFADDLVGELSKYRVMVAPVRYGGGTKLKVIDGMASGAALVTTSVGAQGLSIEHGKHALIADNAPDFAASVLSLLDDITMAQSLSTNAADFAAERYSWDTIRADTARWLSSVVSDKDIKKAA